MAISVQNLFKERKYPFIFTLSVLLTCVVFLLFTNAQYPYFSFSDLQKPQSISSNPPISNPNTTYTPQGDDVSSTDNQIDVNFNWEICKGSSAVDYIPCLDNFQAIKALKSRRHMEHRERHCPDPSPRCLVPLPPGYRFPIPWPKSRDMVRLILW